MRFMDDDAAIRRQRFTTAAILVLSFVYSRAFIWYLGVEFDSSSLDWFWQYLDPEILKHQLLSGVFYLHSQPPVFNLFLGLALKLFPNSPGPFFHAVYAAAGFILYCSLYLLLRYSGFSRTSALICSFLFMISPNAVLYENWLFYTYPMAVLLVLAALALHRYHCGQSAAYAGVFLLCITLVCLIRSAFHLVFLLACVALALVQRGVQRRRVAWMALAAVCLVGSVYLKNYIAFGFFGSSSWMGMNLFNIAKHSVGATTIDELVRLGRLPSVASVPPFSPLEKYSGIDDPHRSAPGPAALTIKTKASGHPNFNHEGYLQIARDYRRASVYLIRKYPRLYLSSVFDAWCVYCLPSWYNVFLNPNKQALSEWISFNSWFRERGLVNLRPLKRCLFGSDGEDYLYPVTNLVFLPSILLLACAASAVRLKRLARSGDASGLAVLFITFTVIYVAVLGNALDYSENNRFRVETDPLLFLLGVIMARDAYVWLMKKMRGVNAGRNGG